MNTIANRILHAASLEPAPLRVYTLWLLHHMLSACRQHTSSNAAAWRAMGALLTQCAVGVDAERAQGFVSQAATAYEVADEIRREIEARRPKARPAAQRQVIPIGQAS